MKTLTTADDRVSGAGHLQPIDRYARPLPLARNAAGGTGSSSKLKYDGRQFQVLDHRSRAALPEADPLRCSISRGRSHPPTAGSSASETPAFPPTGASLYSRRLFEMPRRGEDRPDRDRLALRFEQFKIQEVCVADFTIGKQKKPRARLHCRSRVR